MPTLRSLAARSAVGELSVKTGGLVTRCAAGLLAVSAGNRTESPTSECNIDNSTWPDLVDLNGHSQYDARLGTLGSALRSNGIRTVAVGAAAVPMLADAAGRVDSIAPRLDSAVAPRSVVGTVDDGLYAVPAARREAARQALDARIGAAERVVPRDGILMVAGISDLAAGHADLHTFVVSGPGWPHTELRSSAAGRTPFVQLIDIAPTILAAEGIRIPSSVVGRPMQRSGTVPPSISTYVDDDRHAVDQRTLGQRAFLAIGIVAIVMLLLVAAPWPHGRHAARWLARLVAPAPVLVFLGNALPWWHWSQVAYGAIVLGGCLVVAVATELVARRHPEAGLVFVPIVSFTILAIDQLLGAPLQFSAPLGDSPLTAGRFSGMGNLDFAVMASSALVIGGVVGARLSRAAGIGVAATLALAAIVIDGAPQLGNDIGGVLTLVPASLVLVAMVARVRMTRRRAAMIIVTTIVVAVGVALADYTRPATDQTHVGRFVGQVLHGGAGTEVHRKFDSALGTFGLTTGTFVAAVVLVVAVLCRDRIRVALAASRGAAASALAVAVLAVLGTALNDSGITVAAMAAIVTICALYGGGLLELRRPDGSDEPATRDERRGDARTPLADV